MDQYRLTRYPFLPVAECRTRVEDSRYVPGPGTTAAVLLRHTDTHAECRIRVGSGSTVKSYLESIPTSEFGATTDVH